MSGTRAAAGAEETQGDGAAAPPTETAAERDWDAATDAAARRMGWKPKEEYRGDPSNWVDAQTFVNRSTETPAVMAERYRVLDSRYKKLAESFDQSQRTVSEMAEMLRKSDERARARVMKELGERRRTAVEQGDVDAFNKVEQEIAEVQNDAPAAPPARGQQAAAAGQAPAPEALAWGARNPWFMTDPDMRAFAESYHLRLNRSNPELSLADNLERVTQATMRAFPDEFSGAARGASRAAAPADQAAPAVGAATEGVAGTRRASPRSFEAMPKEARDQFERWKKQLNGKGKPLTKEEFAENYWENET